MRIWCQQRSRYLPLFINNRISRSLEHDREKILYKDNLNRAYKRVKANKGAEGIDGMTVKEALVYLKEHGQELTDRIYRGKYTPSPVRRAAIPKTDGGVRKLGIPTVSSYCTSSNDVFECYPSYHEGSWFQVKILCVKSLY